MALLRDFLVSGNDTLLFSTSTSYHAWMNEWMNIFSFNTLVTMNNHNTDKETHQTHLNEWMNEWMTCAIRPHTSHIFWMRYNGKFRSNVWNLGANVETHERLARRLYSPARGGVAFNFSYFGPYTFSARMCFNCLSAFSCCWWVAGLSPMFTTVEVHVMD